MADSSAVAADMETTPQPAKRAAPAVSPSSPPFPPSKLHARYSPDVTQFAGEISKKVGENDFPNAIVACRDFAWEMSRQLQTIKGVTDDHADGLEVHHKSLYEAVQAHKVHDDQINKLKFSKNLRGRVSATDDD